MGVQCQRHHWPQCRNGDGLILECNTVSAADSVCSCVSNSGTMTSCKLQQLLQVRSINDVRIKPHRLQQRFVPLLLACATGPTGIREARQKLKYFHSLDARNHMVGVATCTCSECLQASHCYGAAHCSILVTCNQASLIGFFLFR